MSVSGGVAPAITNSGTSVAITSVNDAPVIGGAVANQPVNDDATVNPFSTFTVTDPDTQDMFVKVTINNGVFRGDFTAASTIGWTREVIGNKIVYSRYFSPTANIGGAVQAAIQAFVFQPRNNVPVGTSESTVFTVYIKDGSAATDTDNTISVVTTGVAPRPAASVVVPPTFLEGDVSTVIVPTVSKLRVNTLARLLKKPR